VIDQLDNRPEQTMQELQLESAAVPRGKHRSDGLRRIQRCWLRSLVALIAVGVWLGPLGFGKSRWDLAEFLAVFVGASVPLAARALRPSVRLLNSMNQVGQERVIADLQPVVGESSGQLAFAKAAYGADGARLR
jgi:hypothetical protein